MKASKISMALVALFISASVMTAQAPAKQEKKAEPAKKECCDKTKAKCKDGKTAECKDGKKECCKDKAACKDKKGTKTADKK